jgi:hypothetical protein
MPDVRVVQPSRDTPNFRSLGAATAEAKSVGASYEISTGTPVEHNRNAIVRKFLADDTLPTHLCMIDDDVIVPAGALAAMLAVRKPVVSLPTPFLFDGNTYSNCAPWPVDGVFDRSLPTGPTWVSWIMRPTGAEPQRISATGFGCVLVERHVWDMLQQPWFAFQRGDVPGEAVYGEDVYFSRACLAADIEMWCLPDLACSHLHRVDLASWVSHGMAEALCKAAVREAAEARA